MAWEEKDVFLNHQDTQIYAENSIQIQSSPRIETLALNKSVVVASGIHWCG